MENNKAVLAPLDEEFRDLDLLYNHELIVSWIYFSLEIRWIIPYICFVYMCMYLGISEYMLEDRLTISC